MYKKLLVSCALGIVAHSSSMDYMIDRVNSPQNLSSLTIYFSALDPEKYKKLVEQDCSQATPFELPQTIKKEISLLELVKIVEPNSSSSQLELLIAQGAVKVNGICKKDPHEFIRIREDMKLKIVNPRVYTLKISNL